MICAGCKTIIGLEEEDDTLDCDHCKKVFCSKCMVEEDFWYCDNCARVLCDDCIHIYYDDDDDYADHHLVCCICAEEVASYHEM